MQNVGRILHRRRHDKIDNLALVHVANGTEEEHQTKDELLVVLRLQLLVGLLPVTLRHGIFVPMSRLKACRITMICAMSHISVATARQPNGRHRPRGATHRDDLPLQELADQAACQHGCGIEEQEEETAEEGIATRKNGVCFGVLLTCESCESLDRDGVESYLLRVLCLCASVLREK